MAESRVTIAADSISEAGDRLTTMAIQVPWLHLEAFRSLLIDGQYATSRLVAPIKELQRQVAEEPFIPSSLVDEKAIAIWLGSRNIALNCASELEICNIPERDCRNLLAPFLWRTVVITAGEWGNFRTPLASKISPDTQAILDAALAALDSSEPRLVHSGELHLPFFQIGEQDGSRNMRVDLELYRQLASSRYILRLEHVATPFQGNLPSRRSLQEWLHMEKIRMAEELVAYEKSSSNFHGWCQLLKPTSNEA